jgi:hypothetical protein
MLRSRVDILDLAQENDDSFDKGASGTKSQFGKSFGLKDKLFSRRKGPTSQSAIDVGPQSTDFGASSVPET